MYLVINKTAYKYLILQIDFVLRCTNKSKGDTMKKLVKLAAVFLIAISFAACEKAVNPVSPTSLDKTASQITSLSQTGTIEITTPDSRAIASQPLTGYINFYFDDAASTYKYDGRIISDVDKYSRNIGNTGKFERRGDYIKLVDNPIVQADQMGLDLYGDYQYMQRGNEVIIEGESSLGHIKIVLSK